MKFGRRPPRHTARTMRSAILMDRYLRPLGTPPTTSADWVAAVNAAMGGANNWGMLGNDNYGCCVEADNGHTLMLRTANTGSVVIPTEQDILDLYSAETGFNPNDPNTDNGTDMTSDADYMETTGLLGHKADATAMLDHTNLDQVKWSIQLFGFTRLGFNVPAYAMDQFRRGDPWDLNNGDATIVGGHDVPAVMYDGTYFYCVSWGKLQPMTPAFFASFIEETHSELFFDWIKSTGLSPSGFDLASLANDILALGPPSPVPAPPAPTPVPPAPQPPAPPAPTPPGSVIHKPQAKNALLTFISDTAGPDAAYKGHAMDAISALIDASTLPD